MRFMKLFTSVSVTVGAALLTLACGHSQSGTHESAAQVAGDVLTDTTHSPSVDSLFARADSARIQGSPTAPLWIIEVSDFQCPFCRMFHTETYPAIKKDYVETGKARFAYLNFPVQSLHQNAWPAALAAMCAAAQDKFWPMHDALFNSQDSWGTLKDPTPVFDSLATSLGADMTHFKSCVSTKVMMPLVQADKSRAQEHGVNATPTFLIGTQRIVGAESLSEFRRVIDAELAKGRG